MKYIIVVPDGMADNPIEELGNKTPLEVAHTTNMDYLAQNGMTGLIQTIPKGMKPGSDIGNLALMGYDPRKLFTGRSALEAANLDIKLKDDEIAFRCNLVTIVNGKMIDYSAGHISTKEASELIEALNEDLSSNQMKFYIGKGYRHIMVLNVRSPEKYMQIKCAPPHDILNKEIKKYLPSGPESAMLLKLMEKSKKIFEGHSVNNVRVDLNENPANMIWLWGQGTRPDLPSFSEKYSVRGSVISAVDLVNGIGKLAGLEIIDVPGATGYYDTNYLGKAKFAIESLNTKDFVFIHIEAPDEAGHNGDLEAKIASIESIDRDILGTILNHYDLNEDIRILVLPDHPTPVKLRTHTSDPVPFVIAGKGIDPDNSEGYSEPLCRAKGLKFKSGEDLINFFMSRTYGS